MLIGIEVDKVSCKKSNHSTKVVFKKKKCTIACLKSIGLGKWNEDCNIFVLGV
jgi:hypothetical protein